MIDICFITQNAALLFSILTTIDLVQNAKLNKDEKVHRYESKREREGGWVGVLRFL